MPCKPQNNDSVSSAPPPMTDARSIGTFQRRLDSATSPSFRVGLMTAIPPLDPFISISIGAIPAKNEPMPGFTWH
jgi:hypothetical protein